MRQTLFCDSIKKRLVFQTHVETVRLRPFYHKLASRQGAHVAPVLEYIQLHTNPCNMCLHDAFWQQGQEVWAVAHLEYLRICMEGTCLNHPSCIF